MARSTWERSGVKPTRTWTSRWPKVATAARSEGVSASRLGAEDGQLPWSACLSGARDREGEGRGDRHQREEASRVHANLLIRRDADPDPEVYVQENGCVLAPVPTRLPPTTTFGEMRIPL